MARARVAAGVSPLFNDVALHVMGSDFEYGKHSTSVAVGYGLGVSINTAIGAIRIDYSFGSEGSQTWVTMGHPF